jgi:asparagine synthase (glutamine-hydrolysing)
MSAICGILSLSGRAPRLDLLARMMGKLEQHGPDGSGQWHDSSAGLGHQRMHITPESLNERLPLHHAESRITLTIDGRLDNREELLRVLNMSSSQGAPDSALLLRAYQKWGAACADRLVGEFAFAIWDARQRRLYCCTDPMGVRPLFHTEIPGGYFAFASEVKALLAISDAPSAINNRRLAMLGVSAMSVYLEPETTCFENIFRIPAATILSVDSKGARMHEYWVPQATNRLRFNSNSEFREAFQEVFSQAIKARLRSAFPVASLLSGGLDSSAIVSAASRVLADQNKRLVTLSSVPMPAAREHVTGEQDYVDLLSNIENLDMHYVSVPDSGAFDQLETLVQSASLCSYSYQHFLYTALVRAAGKNDARVILDGHGGEYSASSHPRGYLAELLLSGKWITLVKELRLMDEERALRFMAVKRHVLRPMFPYPALKLLNRYARFKQMIEYPVRPGFVRDVLGRDEAQIRDEIFRLLEEYPNHRKNMVRDIQRAQDDIRQRSHAGFVDYHAAQFSYPFLDKRVLEFGLAVDGEYKFKEGSSRRLLRLGMEGLLPEKILSRTSKAPFSPDYHLRYERDKLKALNIVRDFSESKKLCPIVNFNRVFEALESVPDYSPENPMRVDYESQFLVPYAVYLCYFLDNFGS